MSSWGAPGSDATQMCFKGSRAAWWAQKEALEAGVGERARTPRFRTSNGEGDFVSLKVLGD